MKSNDERIADALENIRGSLNVIAATLERAFPPPAKDNEGNDLPVLPTKIEALLERFVLSHEHMVEKGFHTVR